MKGDLKVARVDGRSANELRPIKITRGFLKNPNGSVLIEVGDTKVICTATVEDRVPPFLKGSNEGWITAEYSMIPGATSERNQRESTKGKVGGRTMEIQRLVGRALRSVVDLKALGERTIWLDCDVIQADGGTRTSSITGCFVAMVDAMASIWMDSDGTPSSQPFPIIDYLAATSVGIVDGNPVLDLNYIEDSSAKVDMNVVMTGSGRIVEIQGTAEGEPFTRGEMNNLIDLAEHGIKQLITIQKEVLGELGSKIVEGGRKER